MSTQQPDALRLTDIARYCFRSEGMSDPPEQFESPTGDMADYFDHVEIEKELLARIADLEAQLEAIGAGGVSGPLIGQPQAMPDLSQLTERGAKAWAGVDAQGLREGFTAADMATVSAQGFRDGVASVSAGWQSIETAPKDEIYRDGQSAYAEYILIWYPGTLAPLRARWWQADSGPNNFLADGGWAVFPTHWMPLPPAPGPADGESNG